jgi:hypothetical protein
MSESNNQRIYLACGTVFLTIFSFAGGMAIVTSAPGGQLEVAAVIALAVSIVVLLFNATLLFASKGGPGILAFAKVLLWLSFLIIATALGLCITSMAGSL